MNRYCVYIMTNWKRTTLYIGVTSDLERRVAQHRSHALKGFTDTYNLEKLVYYEECTQVDDAIKREKQLKGWTRAKKNRLIEGMNPHWRDLAADW